MISTLTEYLDSLSAGTILFFAIVGVGFSTHWLASFAFVVKHYMLYSHVPLTQEQITNTLLKERLDALIRENRKLEQEKEVAKEELSEAFKAIVEKSLN